MLVTGSALCMKKSVLIFQFYYFKASFNIDLTSTPRSSRLSHPIRLTDHNFASVLLASSRFEFQILFQFVIAQVVLRHPSKSNTLRRGSWHARFCKRGVLGHPKTPQAEGRPSVGWPPLLDCSYAPDLEVVSSVLDLRTCHGMPCRDFKFSNGHNFRLRWSCIIRRRRKNQQMTQV